MRSLYSNTAMQKRKKRKKKKKNPHRLKQNIKIIATVKD